MEPRDSIHASVPLLESLKESPSGKELKTGATGRVLTLAGQSLPCTPLVRAFLIIATLFRVA